jgi:hypothetical protein
MRQVAVHVPDSMYDQLNDLANQHHLPMSLYTRMLICQAFKIGPEIEEIKKRVDELQACMNGFADAILEDESEELIEAVSRQTTKTNTHL